MNYNKGFGFIGLLITIAIIAILSGVMMKAYYGTKTPAQEVHEGIDAIDKAKEVQGITDQYNQKQAEQIGQLEDAK
jgi:Tfp pilus assembly protein PilE